MAHSAKRLINIQSGFCQVTSVCLLEFWLRSKFQDRANDTVYTGVDPGFFLGGGALASCSTSTPINHIVFFFAFKIMHAYNNFSNTVDSR